MELSPMAQEALDELRNEDWGTDFDITELDDGTLKVSLTVSYVDPMTLRRLADELVQMIR